MKIQVDCGKLIISLFVVTLTLATAVSSKVICPFTKLFHFGDGFTDIGNSIHVSPEDPNPARNPPYGVTYPGWPTGRWSDGFVDFDYTPPILDLSNVVPYLTSRATPENDGVIFSTARSPVLNLTFFKSEGINIPSYAVPLDTQISWFEEYIKSVCSTPKECKDFVANSLLIMGDIEGNDIGYALTQGKSIKEVRSYLSDIVKTLISASRRLLQLGGTRLLIPGNGPIGCYPYILTALRSYDPKDYDELGCLKSVNELVKRKNKRLEKSTMKLKKDYPNAFISYVNLYDGVYTIIKNNSVIGPDGINKALKSCCGIGGLYNFNSNRFCGTPGVPVCPNPTEYIQWDGYHLTHQAMYKVVELLVGPALPSLNCTTVSGGSPPSKLSPTFYNSTLTILITILVLFLYRQQYAKIAPLVRRSILFFKNILIWSIYGRNSVDT